MLSNCSLRFVGFFALTLCAPICHAQGELPSLSSIYNVRGLPLSTVQLLGGGSMDGAIFTVAERSDRALPLLLSGGPGANANVYRRYSTNGPTFGLVQNLGHGDSTVAHTGLLLTPGVYFVPDGQMVTGIWASRDRQGLQWQPAMTLETYDVMPGYKGLRGRFTVAPRPDGSLPVATLGTGNLALEPVIWKQNGPAASFYCGAFNTLSPGVVMEAGTYTVMFGEFPTSSINAVLAEMKYVLPLVGYWAKPS